VPKIRRVRGRAGTGRQEDQPTPHKRAERVKRFGVWDRADSRGWMEGVEDGAEGGVAVVLGDPVREPVERIGLVMLFRKRPSRDVPISG
jgi:hypothetical protein